MKKDRNNSVKVKQLWENNVGQNLKNWDFTNDGLWLDIAILSLYLYYLHQVLLLHFIKQSFHSILYIKGYFYTS